MRKFMLLIFVLSFAHFGFAQQQITKFLPHLVAGSLPASDWESEVFLVNLSGEPNIVTVEFFGHDGSPLIFSTSKGVGSSFKITLTNYASSDVLKIFRDIGLLVSGWAKVYATKPFAVDLEFRQFLSGAERPVGKADVLSSPAENVHTYPLSPNNGIALVNPGSQDASVNFTAFNRAGNKIREGNFVFKRGGHAAVFFKEAPFFLEEDGIIVIASNIPLSSIALNFDGLVFKTIPRIPTPRILDSPHSGIQIGFVYLNSNDRQPIQKAELQKYLAEAVHFQKTLLDKEMPLNGYDPIKLPYDLEDNGLPKVVMVQGGNQELYSFKNRSWDAINQLEIDAKSYIPSHWKYIIYIPDVWKEDDDIPGNGGGGVVYVSIQDVRYMDRAFLGDNTPCARVLGRTKSHCANSSLGHFNHETGHAFWNLEHSAFSDDSSTFLMDQMRFMSMMGRRGDGCFNPKQVGKGECALLPVEALSIARGPLSRLNDFAWIPERDSWPIVEVISKEMTVGFRLKVVLRAEDAVFGISSVAINTSSASPFIQYWKQIDHRDDLSAFTIETTIKPQKAGNQLGTVYLLVKNNQGKATQIQLF